MIIFVKLEDPTTSQPTCAFYNTSDAKFFENSFGTHCFTSMVDIDDHPRGARLRAMTPLDFFGPWEQLRTTVCEFEECVQIRDFAGAEELLNALREKIGGFK